MIFAVFTTSYVVCRPTAKEAQDYQAYYADKEADWPAVDRLMELQGVHAKSFPPEAFKLFRNRLPPDMSLSAGGRSRSGRERTREGQPGGICRHDDYDCEFMWTNCLSFATKYAAIGEERPARKDKTNLIFYGRP
jgi:hypothetical protein